MDEIKKIRFYSCPVCGKYSTNYREIQEHYKRHTLAIEEWIHCRACGAGWSVTAWGLKRAENSARKCYQEHICKGELQEVAAKTFFMTGGVFGFPEIVKGKAQFKTTKKEGVS